MDNNESNDYGLDVNRRKQFGKCGKNIKIKYKKKIYIQDQQNRPICRPGL